MGIFDALTGGAAKTAAKKNAAAIQQGLATGTAALNEGTANAIGILGVGDGSTAVAQSRDLYNRGRSALEQGYGQQQGYLGGIGELYAPLAASGQAALGTRDDALGLNGAEGYGRAKTAFTSSLGYGAGLETGLDSVMRTASARGNLAGGNTSADLYRYGSDYENQRAGAFMDRLTSASQNLNAGIAGQATGLGLQASAAQGLGTGLAGLDQTQGGRLASLYGQGAGLYAGQGQGIAGLNAQATGASVQNNNQLAAAQTQASSNLLDALGGGLMGFSKIGGLTGLVNMFKSG